MSDYKPYTDDPAEFDFERAKLLLDIIVSAGQHGPLFQKIVSLAQNALKDMIQPPQPTTVMPPAGGDPVAIAKMYDPDADAEAEEAKAEADRKAELERQKQLNQKDQDNARRL